MSNKYLIKYSKRMVIVFLSVTNRKLNIFTFLYLWYPRLGCSVVCIYYQSSYLNLNYILKYFFHSVIWVSSKRPIRSLQHLFSSMPFEIFFYPFLPLAPFFSSCLLFLSIFICTASNISFISVMILMFSSSSSWDFQT